MPICSYIVYPDIGKRDTVQSQLESIAGCSVFPAEAHELLLLVTETQNDTEEKLLQHALKAEANVQCMAMTFAHDGENNLKSAQTYEAAHSDEEAV